MTVLSLATSFLLQSGIWFALICAIIGLGAALYLIRLIFAQSPGNDRMRQIAAAIEEGAKAYLNRQIISVSIIAVVIFVLLAFTRDLFTAAGFCIGAVCSMLAGYVGIWVAGFSNCRTAQAATKSQESALRVAFNGGAVTGLLVVALALLSGGLFFLICKAVLPLDNAVGSMVGPALGASPISVFARFGRRLYTQAPAVC